MYFTWYPMEPVGQNIHLDRGLMCHLMTIKRFKFRSIIPRALILLAIWCLRPWVQIMHSAMEDNLSPFDLNIACQSMKNNNRHVYRQSHVRKPPTGNGVEWTECSLIIGTGCQVFSLILDSPVGLSAGIHSAGDLVSETLGSNHAFSNGRQLVSFRFEYRLPVPENRN